MPVIHNLVLDVSNTATFYCTDGLSPLEKYNIENFYNFGGNIVFKDCGVPEEIQILDKAWIDMSKLYQSIEKPSQYKKDVFDALKEDI